MIRPPSCPIETLTHEYDRLSADGFRVLAMASKDIPPLGVVAGDATPYTQADESDLILQGYVAFLDPPKEMAAKAILALQAHGVTVKVPAGARRAVYSTRITRKECLEKFVIVAERRLNHVNREWRLHYNRERPHEARGHLSPAMETPPEGNETVRLHDVVYSSRLGGLLKHYERRAA